MGERRELGRMESEAALVGYDGAFSLLGTQAWVYGSLADRKIWNPLQLAKKSGSTSGRSSLHKYGPDIGRILRPGLRGYEEMQLLTSALLKFSK
jgi:hypothetical protein